MSSIESSGDLRESTLIKGSFNSDGHLRGSGASGGWRPGD